LIKRTRIKRATAAMPSLIEITMDATMISRAAAMATQVLLNFTSVIVFVQTAAAAISAAMEKEVSF
jgi:hypothetical protein